MIPPNFSLFQPLLDKTQFNVLSILEVIQIFFPFERNEKEREEEWRENRGEKRQEQMLMIYK